MITALRVIIEAIVRALIPALYEIKEKQNEAVKFEMDDTTYDAWNNSERL